MGRLYGVKDYENAIVLWLRYIIDDEFLALYGKAKALND
jgi:hypothetical protein